jgi:hypothetical protein
VRNLENIAVRLEVSGFLETFDLLAFSDDMEMAAVHAKLDCSNSSLTHNQKPRCEIIRDGTFPP